MSIVEALIENPWIIVCFILSGVLIYLGEKGKKNDLKKEEIKRKEDAKKQKEEFEAMMVGIKNEKLERQKALSQIKAIFSSFEEKLINEFDKDKNNIVDVIEINDDFNQLLKKHNDIIIERGKEYNKNYIHQFVKVSNYLKNKRDNINLIFKNIKTEFSINGYERRWELHSSDSKGIYSRINFINGRCNSYFELLIGEIQSYHLLLYNALNLINSAVENDQITFYNIYEKLDKLNIFNSNWQNEISQKLTNIDNNFSLLHKEIKDMGENIVNAIWDLSYATEETNDILNDKLGEINSGINANNLLTAINTYQNYQINKNTKSLRG